MNSIISKMQTNNKFAEFIEDIKNKKGPICVYKRKFEKYMPNNYIQRNTG